MTNEQLRKEAIILRERADAMDAHANGKKVQCRSNGADDSIWVDTFPSWISGICYRPKPEPETVGWHKPEHVPALCWLRSTKNPASYSLVTMIECGGVWAASVSGNQFFMWHHLSRPEMRHSTDHITWKPCTLTV